MQMNESSIYRARAELLQSNRRSNSRRLVHTTRRARAFCPDAGAIFS